MITAYVIIVLAWLFVLATFHAYHHWQCARQLDRRNTKLMAVLHEQRQRRQLQTAQLADARDIIRALDDRLAEQAEHMAQQAEAMRLMQQRMSRLSIITTDYHYTDAWRN